MRSIETLVVIICCLISAVSYIGAEQTMILLSGFLIAAAVIGMVLFVILAMHLQDQG